MVWLGCENNAQNETSRPQAFEDASGESADYDQYEYAEADVPPPPSDVYVPPPPPMPQPGPAPEPMLADDPDDAMDVIPPAPAPGETVHVVQRGDTLWKIMRQYYGEATNERKNRIVAANPGLDPDVIYPGQEIVIPEQ
jgi:nucleoid-associated protein YgaU